MMKILLIRHAQTKGNYERFIQGQKDSPITSEGYKQITATANYLSRFPISQLFSSPIQRAITTSEIIKSKQKNCAIISISDLMEIDLAPWVYQSIDNLADDKSVHGYNVFRNMPMNFSPLYGEGFIDVQMRMIRAIQTIIQKTNKDQIIGIVSHSVAIRSLLLWIENQSFNNIGNYIIPSSSISVIVLDNGSFKIERIGFLPEIYFSPINGEKIMSVSNSKNEHNMHSFDTSKLWTDNNYKGDSSLKCLLPLPVGMKESKCPKCGSSHIIGAQIMPTADEQDPNILCLDCGYWWD